MSIKVRDTILGEQVLICAPVTGRTDDDIKENIRAIRDSDADIIEWRVDYYDKRRDANRVVSMLKDIRSECGNMPVIFTYRTLREGGEPYSDEEGYISSEDYVNILKKCADSGHADIIDVEVYHGVRDDVCSLIRYIKDRDVYTLASNHHFNATPNNDDMYDIFEYMHACGADILKLAVMPKNSMDVIRLMEVSAGASAEYDEPIITMSMGKLGLITRIGGELTGSAVTFASVSGESAPGQLGADMVRDMLDILRIQESDVYEK